MNRRTKESVAIVIKDEQGHFLAVKRASEDSFGGMWGLAAASHRDGETNEDTVKRAAKDKLGVEVEVVSVIGDRTEDKGGYDEQLTEYEVRIISGELALEVRDSSVSAYAEMQFFDDPAILLPAARNGSICSRIYLGANGMGWE